jgi:hypothetical protein
VSDEDLPAPRAPEALEAADDPPVVARLVVEIRSDGSRTVARGAIEDLASGERVAIEARGTTPLALASNLAASLAGTLTRLPFAAASVVKSLLPRKRD